MKIYFKISRRQHCNAHRSLSQYRTEDWKHLIYKYICVNGLAKYVMKSMKYFVGTN